MQLGTNLQHYASMATTTPCVCVSQINNLIDHCSRKHHYYMYYKLKWQYLYIQRLMIKAAYYVFIVILASLLMPPTLCTCHINCNVYTCIFSIPLYKWTKEMCCNLGIVYLNSYFPYLKLLMYIVTIICSCYHSFMLVI